MDQRDAPSKRETQVLDILEKNAAKIQAVLAKNLDRDRFVRLCVGALRQTPKLRECSAESLINSMMASGVIGLEPNTPTQEAFLIPYKGEAKFQLGYQGLLTLAARNGITVQTVDCIRKNDEWEVHRGTRNELIHRIVALSEAERGDELAYYCVVRLPDGSSTFTIMPIDEINKVKASSRGACDPDSPWQRWFSEQAKKTVMKRALKLAPGKSEQLTRALAVDGEFDAGKKPTSLAVDLDIPEAARSVRPGVAHEASKPAEKNITPPGPASAGANNLA